MKVNISDMLETLNACYDEMNGDVEATNDIIIDDLLIALGYNRKRNKNIKKVRNGKVDWEIAVTQKDTIAIKVYAIGTEIKDKARLEVIEASESNKFSVLVITNGEFINVLRFVDKKSSFEEIADIHIKKDMDDKDIAVLSAISKDGFDLSILDSYIPKDELTSDEIFEIIKGNEAGLKNVVLNWIKAGEGNVENFDTLWVNFYKDFAARISVKEKKDSNVESSIRQYEREITELTNKVKTLERTVESKDAEIAELQHEIDESTVNVHKRAVEMLDIITASGGERNYVALINDDIIQYKHLHKFVGRVLQHLYKIKSFEAQSFIFNGNIFRLESRNVKYNDLIINNKAYDVIISDDEEDDAILKLGTLFSKFSDITFVCKKTGTRLSNQPTGIGDEILEKDEKILTDEIEAADKISATSGNKISFDVSDKAKQSDKKTDKLSNNDKQAHESVNEEKDDNLNSSIGSQSNNQSNKGNAGATKNGTPGTNDNTSTNEKVGAETGSNDNCNHMDSEKSEQLTKNDDKLLSKDSTTVQAKDTVESADSGDSTDKPVDSINNENDNCSDSTNSNGKDNNNCDTSEADIDGSEDKHSENEAQTNGNGAEDSEKTIDDDIEEDIDLGFSEFEGISEGLDDISGEDVVAEQHEKIIDELSQAEAELADNELEALEPADSAFNEELDAELADLELDNIMNDDDEENFDPFAMLDDDDDIDYDDIENDIDDIDIDDEEDSDNEDITDEDADDSDEEESDTEEDAEADEDAESSNDIEPVDFGDIGTDTSEVDVAPEENETEQNNEESDKVDEVGDRVVEIIEQKLNEAKPKDSVKDEDDDVILDQFEPEIEASDSEVIKAEADEDSETEEIESNTVENEANDTDTKKDTENILDDIPVEKQEATVPEIGSGAGLADDTDEYEAYFAEQGGLDISLGREDDEDNEEETETAEVKEEVIEKVAAPASVTVPKIEDTPVATVEPEDEVDEEYEENMVLLVAQMQNVDKLMYTDDDVTFFNIKYIGSNDVTYLVNANDDETMTYEKLLCKCIQAVVATQEYNGDNNIIEKLKQKDLTGINEHIKHKSAEYKDFPALKVAPFVVANITQIKDVALAVLDVCKAMEIDMTQLFMYIEADTESDYIIENYGYDEDSVQLRDTEMYTHDPNTKVNESIAILTGNMFNKVIVSENSLRVHKDVILETVAVRTKYLSHSFSDPSEFASIVEETLTWAANNKMDINLAKIGPVLGTNYRIVSTSSDDVSPDNTQIDVKGMKVYVTNVKNWQIPTALIKLHTAITGNTSIAIKVRINADAVNYYGSEYDTSEPSASLAITSYVNYVASCVKQVKG